MIEFIYIALHYLLLFLLIISAFLVVTSIYGWWLYRQLAVTVANLLIESEQQFVTTAVGYQLRMMNLIS